MAECCHIAGVVQSRLFRCTSGIQTAADRSCMVCDGHLLKQQKMFTTASDCCSPTFEDNLGWMILSIIIYVSTNQTSFARAE